VKNNENIGIGFKKKDFGRSLVSDGVSSLYISHSQYRLMISELQEILVVLYSNQCLSEAPQSKVGYTFARLSVDFS